MEADLDKNEAIKPQPGELYGDRLLNSYYVQTSGGGKKKRVSCNLEYIYIFYTHAYGVLTLLMFKPGLDYSLGKVGKCLGLTKVRGLRKS